MFHSSPRSLTPISPSALDPVAPSGAKADKRMIEERHSWAAAMWSMWNSVNKHVCLCLFYGLQGPVGFLCYAHETRRLWLFTLAHICLEWHGSWGHPHNVQQKHFQDVCIFVFFLKYPCDIFCNARWFMFHFPNPLLQKRWQSSLI